MRRPRRSAESIAVFASGNPTAAGAVARPASRSVPVTVRCRCVSLPPLPPSHPLTDSVMNGSRKQASTAASNAGGTDHDTVRSSWVGLVMAP